jgi:hypothetical protein
MPRLHFTGRRPRASDHAVASMLQTYTGLPLPEALRAVSRARGGEEVALEFDDEFAAHDLASLLMDFGMRAEVDETL